MKRKVLMLATGGTIASKSTDQGLQPGLSPEEVLSYIPQVWSVCDVDTYEVCKIDSTNMTPGHWEQISRIIEETYDKYDGFVILHGTDTMAYTAAALSYMIQHSPKPIVITGSQRPINMEVTDAKTNLMDSFIFASDSDSQDVVIVFDGKVIIGTRAKKIRAKSYNAFESINFPYSAVIQEQQLLRFFPAIHRTQPPTFYHKMGKSVFVLKLTPGMKPEVLPFLFENYDGIVIESFGVGGVPESISEEFYHQLDKWQDRNKYVVMATQVPQEGSQMSKYQVGQKAKEDYRLMESYDMTLEATITKLIWLMSREEISPDRVRKEFYRKINYDILYQDKV